MTIDKTKVTVITKGLLCIGFVLFSTLFIMYLFTNMVLYGSPLNEGDQIIKKNVTKNQSVIDLGTIELRDDRLNETDEILDEVQHAKESAIWLHNSAYRSSDNNNTTCNPAYKIMEQWIPNKFKCYNT